MRTVLLANNRVGYEVARYLLERDELAMLVLHPEDHRKRGDELSTLTFDSWTWPDGLSAVRAVEPECLLSVYFGYRIPPTWLAVPSWRAVNIHPALLPFNRGAAPNAWPLVDGSPAGVTIHEMDVEFDTGGILAQREVETRPDDTAASLHRRLEDAAIALFRETWPTLAERPVVPQEGAGSEHRMKDLQNLDLGQADLEVLDRLRARTFPPFGAEFSRGGKRYRARIEIEELPDDGLSSS